MKTLTLMLAACLWLAGCQSASTTSTPRQTTTKAFKYSTDDGTTMHSAVEIRTRSGTEGSNLMREWIRANHPGFTIQEQELMPDQRGEKMYNMITIIGPNDSMKRVYFDVTQFYQRVGDSIPNSSRTGFPPR